MGNRLCALFLATAMALGCGTIQVDVVKPYDAGPRPRPTQIIVFNFEAAAVDIRLSDEDGSVPLPVLATDESATRSVNGRW